MASSYTMAIPSEVANATEQKADAYADTIGNAPEFLREVDDTMLMALAGEYGAIKGADVERLKQARDTIVLLLKDEQRATDLRPDQRLELYNAQEVMTAILRNDEKNRKVCTRIQSLGTRITQRECMTVAQREQRTRDARENTERSQRVIGPPPL
jgi:hypothetical protein